MTWTTGVAITGGAQALSNGIEITFLATTGHTIGDQWEAGTDSLYAFVSTNISYSMKSVNIAGVQDGNNTAFSFATAPPAGSNVLFRSNGIVLEEVAANPTSGQFTIVGADVVSGTAFPATDFLDAWVEDTTPSVLFRELTLEISGAKATSLLSTPIGFEPRLFLLYNGVGQYEVETTPGVNQFKASLTPEISLTLGLAPLETDWVALYTAGANLNEDLLPESLLDLRQLERRLLVITNRQLDRQEANMCLDETWRAIVKEGWSFLKKESVITTRPVKTDGTVQVIEGASYVIGTGTSWTVADVGSLFHREQDYRIIDVDETNQILTLDAPYVAASASGVSYSVYKKQYALDPEAWRILTIRGESWPLTEVSQTTLDWVDPYRNATGLPYYFAYTEPTANGVQQVELWPIPVTRLSYRYIALLRSHLEDPETLLSDISNVILLGGAEYACPIIANKKMSAGDSAAAAHWIQQSSFWGGKYREELAQARKYDRKRFGRTDSNYGQLFDRFSDDPGVDLRGVWVGSR